MSAFSQEPALKLAQDGVAPAFDTPGIEALLSSLDGMVYRCRDDDQWTMEYVSEGCVRLTGYQSHDLLFNNRLSYETITHLDDRQRVRDEIHQAVRAGHRYEVEYRIIDSDGRLRWVLERGTGLQTENGLHIEGLILDITRIKLAEDKARAAEQRYRSLFDNALEGIFRTTLDGRYLDVNPSLAHIYGYASPEELIASVNDIKQQLYVNPERRSEFLHEVTSHGLLHNFESQVYRRDGKIIWISENVRVVRDMHGKVRYFEGTVEDITEQKEYQQSLIEASEAAAAANHAKSAFLANMSHEIRTPMNGVIGMTELLSATTLDRTQREYLDTIRSSADALLTVINDILDFSKIEAGRMDIESVETEVRNLVEDVGTMLAFQAAAKQLELIVNISPDVPERVMGDGQRIRQCLVNLAGNAIKFTQRGEVVITVCTVARQQGQVVTLFEVRDTGIGIASDKLQALFEPFVQADSSTTRHFGGTGLGLSIVRRLVEMMGGEVGVNSELGKGSCFWFTLPFEPVEQTGLLPVLSPPLTGRRVLVVDDNQTNRRVLMAHLRHAGYEATEAVSGVEALQFMTTAQCQQQPFEVVIVDMQMPAMDGAQLGALINGDATLSQSRLVMLTSMDRQGDVQRFSELGFAGYLTKPIRARELLGCVERVLASESHAWHSQRERIITRNALKDEVAFTSFVGRVLLVEDNPVNQMVARNFLERHGCVVEIANNGAEAVRAYECGQFDLVFMDMQMPVMDGLTATRKIRDFEGWRPRTPIVALTANAMDSQADRCIAAGMDDFITKPIDRRRLREVLEKYLRSASEQNGKTAGVSSEAGNEALHLRRELPPAADTVAAAEGMTSELPPCVDWTQFEAIVAGEAAFARELMDVFVSSTEQNWQELRNAYHAQDFSALRRSAHKLKGACSNLCALRLSELAAALEHEASLCEVKRDTECLTRITGHMEQLAVAVPATLQDVAARFRSAA